MNHWMQRVFKGACTRCLNWSAGCVLLLENKLKLGFILCCSLAWTRPSIRSMSPGLPWLCVCVGLAANRLNQTPRIRHNESDHESATRVLNAVWLVSKSSRTKSLKMNNFWMWDNADPYRIIESRQDKTLQTNRFYPLSFRRLQGLDLWPHQWRWHTSSHLGLISFSATWAVHWMSSGKCLCVRSQSSGKAVQASRQYIGW